MARRAFLTLLVLGLPALRLEAAAPPDPLPSWNDGPAKRAVVSFVQATTDRSSASYVSPEARVATFDQDGTLWVEHPVYAQVVFALDRVVALAPQHPEWKTTEPFRTVLSRDRAAMAKLTTKDLEAIVMATHSGMTVDAFQRTVKDWMAAARDRRWKRPYTALIYQPMLEVMRYLRAKGYRTYVVTGGGQDFVRTYSDDVYGVMLDQVIGSALETQYTYDQAGNGVLMRTPKLLLNNDLSGKPEDIYLFLGQRPQAAFGNSAGDRQMLEYTQHGEGPRLLMLVLHDDADREYAYGPARGLPDTEIGAFPQALYDEARSRRWTVISMKRDWRRVLPRE